MRVLHISPYFAPAFVYGGPPRSILGLCKALRKIGVDASVFTTTANGTSDLAPSAAQWDIYESVPVHYFSRTFPKRFFRASTLAATLPRVIDDYDLLHVHGVWNYTNWNASLQARNLGKPYIISTRGMLDAGSMTHKSWRKRVAYTLLERDNLNAASFLHASSQAEAEAIARYALETKVFVLANGIEVPDESLLPPLSFRKRFNLEGGESLIVFLGRIHPTKRLDLVSAAFAQVLKTIPTARLVIAGPNENNFRQHLAPYFNSIERSVHWLGEVGQEEKWSLLREADALVMCSDSESFGLSVIEALSAGVPVVVTRTCPWAELETEGCGYWVPQEAFAIADALTKILTNQPAAKIMGERGKALSTAKYRWEGIAKQMAEYYLQSLQSTSSNRASYAAPSYLL